jgi:spore coat polysaccharide biosynthesis protein SpsF
VKTAIIVQARHSSQRLTGKVLLSLGPRTVLEEVLRRCLAVRNADVVVCATSDRPEDAPIAELAERAGVSAFRGPLEDVLKRYRLAAESVSADVILRVTADCPLIDPALCDEVLALRAARKADYCANNMPPSFPHGLDCEAFTYAALARADQNASDASAREHVTPWLRTNSSVTRTNLAGPGGAVTDERWTLDYPEDLEFMRAVFKILPGGTEIPGWRRTHDLLVSLPELAEINRARRVARS